MSSEALNIENTVASSGSYIGAVLETSGFYYQEMILESFLAPMNSGIGAFFFIVGAFIALLAIVQQGKFALGSWLLIGPCLFFFVLNVKMSTYGSSWMFGDEERNYRAVRAEVQKFLEEKDLKQEEPARVSWLFAWYTKLVSGTVQEVVRVLSQGREGTDLLHQRRVDAFSAISTSVSDNPGFTALLHHVYLFRCRNVIDKGRLITDPNEMPSVQTNINQYKNALQRPVAITRPVAEYLAGLQAWDTQLVNDIMIGDNDAINLKMSKLAQETLEGTESNSPSDFSSEEYKKYLGQFGGGNKNLTCSQVWDFSRLGILIESRKIVDSILAKTAEGLESTPDDEKTARYFKQLVFDLGKVVGIKLGHDKVKYEGIESSDLHFTELEKLYKAVGSYLFRNELNRGLTSSFIAQFTDQISSLEVGAPGIRDIVGDDRKRLALTEGQERSKLMTNAGQLPYYQGVLLYFLSILFPFFALLLLIPGRHSGFAMWFGFYLWAKSWDIGFAVVMMVDDILFSIFDLRHQVKTADFEITNGMVSTSSYEFPQDAALAVRMVSEMDPTFQPATYYAIISTLLHSIPMVTAYLILGGMKGGSGLIAQGMRTYSDHFAQGSFGLSSARWVVANTTQANHHTAQVASRMAAGYIKAGVQGAGKDIEPGNMHQKSSSIGAENSGAHDQLVLGRMHGNQSNQSSNTGQENFEEYGQTGAVGQWSHSLSNTQARRPGSPMHTLALSVLSTTGQILNTVATQKGSYASEQGDMLISSVESTVVDSSFNQKTNSTNNLGANIEVGYIAGDSWQDALFDRQNKNFEEFVSLAASSVEGLTSAIGQALRENSEYQSLSEEKQKSFLQDNLAKYIVNSSLVKQGLSGESVKAIMSVASGIYLGGKAQMEGKAFQESLKKSEAENPSKNQPETFNNVPASQISNGGVSDEAEELNAAQQEAVFQDVSELEEVDA